MFAKRSIKIIAIVALAILGAAYWYYAEHKSSPLEEIGKIANLPPGSSTSTSTSGEVELQASTLQVQDSMKKGNFAATRTVYLPKGWHASLFASDLGKARFMASGKGTFLLVTSQDRGMVYELGDQDGNGVADVPRVVVSGLKTPNGIAAHTDACIAVAETNQVIDLCDDQADHLGFFPKKSIFIPNLPIGGEHVTRSIAFGSDGAAYVSVGSSCNDCADAPRRAAILHFDANGKNETTFASGLRNSVGITFKPGTNELWGTDNGRDNLGDNLPPDEVNVITKGNDFGWPYCYGNRIADPNFHDASRCTNTVTPKIEIQAHSAPLGLRWIGNQLYISYHGSWNRSVKTGYKVVRADPSKNYQLTDFMTGFLVGGSVWGRPVDVIEGAAGSIYVSDDLNGAIYKLTHD